MGSISLSTQLAHRVDDARNYVYRGFETHASEFHCSLTYYVGEREVAGHDQLLKL